MVFPMKRNLAVEIRANSFVVFENHQGLIELNEKICVKTAHLFSRFSRGASNFGLIFLIVVVSLIGICLLVRHLQRRQSMNLDFSLKN